MRRYQAAASMGPRLMSRGGHERVEDGVRIWNASMGPRLMSRGGDNVLVGAGAGLRLQWGRGS